MEKHKEFNLDYLKKIMLRNKKIKIKYTIQKCNFGFVFIAICDLGIISIQFSDFKEFFEEKIKNLNHNKVIENLENADQHEWSKEILNYLENPTRNFTLPIFVEGTFFQKKVWQALKQIPTGKTQSYKKIAEQIGLPKSVRAVANACATNPIAFVIPCHRIIRSNGALSDYRWGKERKRQMLEFEKALL
ncbi:methylated-DNA--[protein]-cysteine S-methyltransferase [Silvanigrella aquatica]|uniref:methylated-DNA--[protein]-cysteine S-methyltransferase n=1 Tax=Silvanigrella aquatica TaxID=1915309 RepID=A0A1L4D0B4_9BACT|nr:methylated-DNA--[protein]-cysteine S-methyltransferase [Silvanigrella aquatica]APJ03634.1 hypothetical protein AXG55_06825 [Silvanigrella aquatica]